MLCFKHFGYATYCLPDTNKKNVDVIGNACFYSHVFYLFNVPDFVVLFEFVILRLLNLIKIYFDLIQ